MDNTAALISIYSRGFRICLIITVLAAALTVFLFFRLDIRQIIASRSGLTRRRAARDIERNRGTGRQRQTNIDRDATEKTKESTLKMQRGDSSEHSARRDRTDETTDMRSDETVDMTADATTDMRSDETVDMTAGATVDMRTDETIDLQPDETADIPASPDKDEAPVTQELGPQDTVLLNEADDSYRYHGTPAKPFSDFRFEITEYTVIVHTDEIIE